MNIKEIIEHTLIPDSEMLFTYDDREYHMNCYDGFEGEKVYSVCAKEWFGRGMNVSKITNKYISLYTYDMMGQKTTYKMALDKMIAGDVIINGDIVERRRFL